jgi:hypothetical protein
MPSKVIKNGIDLYLGSFDRWCMQKAEMNRHTIMFLWFGAIDIWQDLV